MFFLEENLLLFLDKDNLLFFKDASLGEDKTKVRGGNWTVLLEIQISDRELRIIDFNGSNFYVDVSLPKFFKDKCSLFIKVIDSEVSLYQRLSLDDLFAKLWLSGEYDLLELCHSKTTIT